MLTLARTRYLEEHELEALLRAARERAHPNAPRDHALLALLGNIGCRPGEALAVSVADLDLTEHHARVRIRRLKRRRELGVIDDLPLSRALAALLRRYLKQAGLTDPGARLFPMTVRQAERLFDLYVARAGLPAYYTLYCLRHTAGTRTLEATGDVRLVQELLGHASLTSTQIYAHVSPRRQREAAELAGSIT